MSSERSANIIETLCIASHITTGPTRFESSLLCSNHLTMADPMRPVPIGGNINRGPQLLAVLWSETSIALAVVCLRVFARAKYVKKFWWDDWLMFFTMVSKNRIRP